MRRFVSRVQAERLLASRKPASCQRSSQPSQGWLSTYFPLTRLFLSAVVIAAGVALAVAPLPLAVAGIAGIAFVVVVLQWPQIGLWALPFAVPFGSLRELPVAGYALGATEALVGLTLLAWLARGVAERRLRIKAPPLLIPLLLLWGAMLLSALGMYAVPPTAKELVKWGEILVVYVLAFNLIDSRRDGLTLAAALLLAGGLSAVHGVAGSLLRIGPPQFAILGGRLYRAAGTFAQPNPFGGYMNYSLPLAISLLGAALVLAATEQGGGKMENGEEQNQSHSPFSIFHFPVSPYLCGVALAAISAALATGLMLSWSRGAWLGAVAGLATVGLAWPATILGDKATDAASRVLRRRVVTLLWLGAVAIIVLVLLGGFNVLPASINARIDSALATFTTLNARGANITDANFATLERVAHWQAAWDMWRDHFWTGVGIGNYAAVYPQYALSKWPYALGHAHNIYFNMAAETGLIGLMAYLIFVGSAMWHTGRVARRSADLMVRGVAIGVLGVIVALAVHNFFDNMYVHAMGVHLALALGLVPALEQPDTK